MYNCVSIKKKDHTGSFAVQLVRRPILPLTLPTAVVHLLTPAAALQLFLGVNLPDGAPRALALGKPPVDHPGAYERGRRRDASGFAVLDALVDRRGQA